MANKTVSNLNELTTVSNSDVLLVETATETLKVTKGNLLKEVNEQLNAKSNASHTHDEYVTENELNAKGLATETFVTNKIAEVSTANATTVFNGLKATFYGDSLTERNGHYTKGYHSWISDILGFVSYENYGVSGYTIKNVADKITNTTATGDIIFVMAGVNDQTFHKPLGTFNDDSSTDTTYGALRLLCSTLKEKYPTKLIVYITPHYQIRYPSNLGITSYEVSKAIKEICYLYGIPVYDNYQLSGIYPQNATNKNLFTTDGCHWNNHGHEVVGKNIAKYMINTFGYIYTNTSSTPNISITLSTSTLSLNEGGNSSFTVRLAQQPSANKTVSLSVNNSDVRLDKTQLTFTTSNWNVAQTINVTVAEDDSDYNNESCIISLSGSGLNSAVVNVTITDNDEQPSTPTPTPTPTSYIGKTATITSKRFADYYHLTALINKPDFNTTNKPFSLEMKVSNISNIIDCPLNIIYIFNDTSGEVTNSQYVGQMAGATPTDVIDGNTATITTTGTIPGNPTESYLKIPLGIGVSNVPASFKIDSLVLTIDNQEQQILKLGGFFNDETIEFTDSAEEPSNPCTSISLGVNSLSFTDTISQTLTATLTPPNTTDTLTWSVEPAGIASVVNGVVTPIANGDCVITAKCGTQTTTCSVNVNCDFSVSFVGKTGTITQKKYADYFHLTTVLNKPDFDINGKAFDATMQISNISNISNCPLSRMGIFSDSSGNVENGAFVNEIANGTPTCVVDGDTAIVRVNGTFYNNPSAQYLKIPFGLGLTNVPASFKIDSFTLTIDGQEQEVLEMGGFFNQEKFEIK